MEELERILKEMCDRREFLKAKRFADGGQSAAIYFDPNERLGELQIWIIEISQAINKLKEKLPHE